MNLVGKLSTECQRYVCDPTSKSELGAATQKPREGEDKFNGLVDMLQRRKRFFANVADDEVPNSQDTHPDNKRRRGNKGKNPKPVQREDTQQNELDTYLAKPVINSKAYLNDPIAWWRDIGAKRFPSCLIWQLTSSRYLQPKQKPSANLTAWVRWYQQGDLA